MATTLEWRLGYARQADADFKTYQSLQAIPGIEECHRLLFLQMACEKLCKANLIEGGTSPLTLQSSHGYIANPLPTVIQQQILRMKQRMTEMQGVLQFTRHLAREIELLNPAIDRDGRRPDNCEYPWENGDETLHSPLTWAFTPSQLLKQPYGQTFLKLVRAAITQLL